MAKQPDKGPDKSMRWIVLSMVLLVIVTGVIFSMLSQNNKVNATFSALDGQKLQPAIVSTIDIENGSAITFNPGLPKVIDLWEDPQCPVCQTFEDSTGEYVNSLIRQKKASVRFHILSFLGEESVRAANAAFCAADEGQYLDFHTAIYAVQSKVENSGFLSSQTLVNIGKKIGINSSNFADCVTKGKKINLVKLNYDSMSKYGVQGTPTVFINGKLWQRQSQNFDLGEFRTAVEAG